MPKKRQPDTMCLFSEHSIAYSVVKRSEEHTSELQSRQYLVCRLLLEKKKTPSSMTNKRACAFGSRHVLAQRAKQRRKAEPLAWLPVAVRGRSEEHTSAPQSHTYLVLS